MTSLFRARDVQKIMAGMRTLPHLSPSFSAQKRSKQRCGRLGAVDVVVSSTISHYLKQPPLP
eukprot:scaffold1230_cov97-Skeletonema_dohrnii-CCMP3373.AAC.15